MSASSQALPKQLPSEPQGACIFNWESYLQKSWFLQKYCNNKFGIEIGGVEAKRYYDLGLEGGKLCWGDRSGDHEQFSRQTRTRRNSSSSSNDDFWSDASTEDLSHMELKRLVGSSAYPHAVAVAAAGTTTALTYSDLLGVADELGSLMMMCNLQIGDAVASVLNRDVPVLQLVVFLATTRWRWVAAPLNPDFKYEELLFYLEDTRSKLVFADPSCVAATEAAAHLKIPTATVSLDIGGCDVKPKLVMSHSSGVLQAIQNESPKPRPSDHALLLHTSGTTSKPKCVPLSHLNLCTSINNVVRWYGLTSNDSTLVVQPLFHVGGLVTPTLSTLASGGTVALGTFDADQFWCWVKHHKVTWYTCVPTVHKVLLARAPLDFPSGSMPPALRFVRSGSAPLGPDATEKIERTFQCPLIEAYGMTEAAQLLCANPLPPAPRKVGTVGLPAGPELSLRDPANGALVEVGEPGEVCARGNAVFEGYLNNEQANGEAFRNGWFRSGDLAVQDADGYITIVGRIKEMIKRGGEQIAPAKLEKSLTNIPGLSRVICFGAPHPVWGEVVHAAAIIDEKTEQKASETELLDLLLSRVNEVLEAHEVPERVYFLKDAQVPLTPTKKVQRGKLLDVCKGMESPGTKTSPFFPKDATADDKLDSKECKIIQMIIDIVHELGISSSIEQHTAFMSVGITSVLVPLLTAHLATRTGITNIPLTTVFDYPTPQALAQKVLDIQSGDISPIFDFQHKNKFSIQRSLTSMHGRVQEVETWAGFCEVINKGLDIVGTVPEERWSLDELEPDKLEDYVVQAVQHGCFLSDLSMFDNTFFNISNSEATLMDPQQRILLENSYNALYGGGYTKDNLLDSELGVFLGIIGHDFAQFTIHGDSNSVLASSGCFNSMAAGRISFAFGMRGPCQAIDTACSSALVAAANAQCLCDSAVVSGVNAILAPTLCINFAKKGILSIDGRCKTFDESANGYVRSEACVSGILEPVDSTRADSNFICRSSVTRHDGASVSLTAPSGKAQQALHVDVITSAKIDPTQIAHIESHGTGTVLGDPIEVNAQFTVFQDTVRKAADPMIIGGVKANIGHAEACAGLAGLWKLLLSLRQAVAAPNAKLCNMNVTIAQELSPLDGLFVFPVECTKLGPSEDGLLTGEVVSLGANGTIAASVLQTMPGKVKEPATAVYERKNFSWDQFGRPWVKRVVTSTAQGPDKDVKELAAAEVLSKVMTVMRKNLGLEAALDVQTGFLEAGFDSLSVLEFQSELAKEFNVRLPVNSAADYPTPLKITQYLLEQSKVQQAKASEKSTQEAGVIKKLKDGTGEIFFVHGVDGDPLATLFLKLAQELPYNFYSIRFLESAREKCHDVTELADFYISLIKQVQPAGPYIIGGYSFGSIIAHAIVLQLEAAGDSVAGLILGDFEVAYPPAKFSKQQDGDRNRMGGNKWEGGKLEALTLACRRFGYQGGAFDEAVFQERMAGAVTREEREMRAMYFYMPSHMARREWDEYIDMWASAMDGLHAIVMPNGASSYEPPGVVQSPTLLLRALHSPEFASAITVNQNYCKGLSVAELEGAHYNLLTSPYVEPTAVALDAWVSEQLLAAQ